MSKFLSLIIGFILLPFTSFSQNESIGLRLGYTHDMRGKSINNNNYTSNYDQYSVGIEWVQKYLEYENFTLGLDFIMSKHSDTDYSYILSLNTGKKSYFSNERYFNYYGILFEYDIISSANTEQLRQNGIGFFYAIGKDFVLTEDIFLSVMPLVQVHGFPMFKKREAQNNPVSGAFDWGFRITIRKRRHQETELN